MERQHVEKHKGFKDGTGSGQTGNETLVGAMSGRFWQKQSISRMTFRKWTRRFFFSPSGQNNSRMSATDTATLCNSMLCPVWISILKRKWLYIFKSNNCTGKQRSHNSSSASSLASSHPGFNTKTTFEMMKTGARTGQLIGRRRAAGRRGRSFGQWGAGGGSQASIDWPERPSS